MADDVSGTPFSVTSFNYYPGSTRGVPQGPLPATPSTTESSEDEEEFVPEMELPARLRRKTKTAPPPSTSKCHRCLARFPYLTFLAALLTTGGGLVFAVNLDAAGDTAIEFFMETMHLAYPWMEAAEVVGEAAGGLVIALSLLIFFVSLFTATHLVHFSPRKLRKKVGSRIPSLILILVLYPAVPVWIAIFGVSVALTVLACFTEGLCHSVDVRPLWASEKPPISSTCDTILEGEDCINCIDLYEFHFLFPKDTRKEDMWLCGSEVFDLCASASPSLRAASVLCVVGSSLVVLGIMLHFTALAYTRTALMEEEKRREAREHLFIQRKIKSALLRSSSSNMLLLQQKTRDRDLY